MYSYYGAKNFYDTLMDAYRLRIIPGQVQSQHATREVGRRGVRKAFCGWHLIFLLIGTDPTLLCLAPFSYSSFSSLPLRNTQAYTCSQMYKHTHTHRHTLKNT